MMTIHNSKSTRYVVFHFTGHGRVVGDVLLMQDCGQVATKEIVDKFVQLPKEMCKFFFTDACRGTGSDDPTPDQAYCPTLENSLLARSTLPYRIAHTGDTYGECSGIRQLLLWCTHVILDMCCF